MSEGDVSIVDTEKMKVRQRVKSVHLIFITAVAFSPSGRCGKTQSFVGHV